MSWFKVDDAFSMHPKVVDAGNAAIGLWVRCGSWSAAHGTEGHIPTKIAYQFGARREIDCLVSAGLWAVNGAGFNMPGFLEFNPSKEQDDARKAGNAERQRRAREARTSLRSVQ